jgi:hypothetical protein
MSLLFILTITIIAPTSSYALFVTDQLSINFFPPDPILPGDPTFTSLTGGEATFFQLFPIGEGQFLISIIDQITVPTLNAGDGFTTNTVPPNPGGVGRSGRDQENIQEIILTNARYI